MSSERPSGAQRLERLWSGTFGDSYTERNIRSGDGRRPFWSKVLNEFPVARVLEVGCNVGANLRWIADDHQAVGIDVNHGALLELRKLAPRALPVRSAALQLPFPDATFDLTFTAGVLIHQSPESLSDVMREIFRCSRRYVLCAEYFSAEPVEVPYRGETGALFKRDFGGLYQELFPKLVIRSSGFLARAEGWDDVTYWLFEKHA
jgi:pseudaminic acid biosynthesis-associated methylase